MTKLISLTAAHFQGKVTLGARSPAKSALALDAYRWNVEIPARAWPLLSKPD
jgi:hypothetical protein